MRVQEKEEEGEGRGIAGDGEGRRKCWSVCAGGTEGGVTGPRQQETVSFVRHAIPA